ncbi:MAG: hypothetical protein ACTHL8_12140 [Burkholderiaceae bacterium]
MAERKVEKLTPVSAANNSFRNLALDWRKGQPVRCAAITTTRPSSTWRPTSSP